MGKQKQNSDKDKLLKILNWLAVAMALSTVMGLIFMSSLLFNFSFSLLLIKERNGLRFVLIPVLILVGVAVLYFVRVWFSRRKLLGKIRRRQDMFPPYGSTTTRANMFVVVTIVVLVVVLILWWPQMSLSSQSFHLALATAAWALTPSPTMVLSPTPNSGMYFSYEERFLCNGNATPFPPEIDVRLLWEKLEEVQGKVTLLEQRVNASEDSSALQAKVAALDKRVQDIEEVILDNPERAMSLVLLGERVKGNEAKIEDLQQEFNKKIDRLYSLLKWSLGAIWSITVAVVVSTISRVVEGKSRKRKSDERDD